MAAWGANDLSNYIMGNTLSVVTQTGLGSSRTFTEISLNTLEISADIVGDAVPVTEPGVLGLLIAGLSGLAFTSRRRRDA